MSTHLELLPAVDIADGQAVQLVQGVAGSEKRFGDPVEAALRWQEAGAEWIHLVDLDAAFGRGHNRELQAKIVGTLDIRVEMSGGIRDDESLAAAMEARLPAGQHRHRGARAARSGARAPSPSTATGWPSGSTYAGGRWRRAAGPATGGDLYDVLARLDAEGCARYVVTDVNKDGMLEGPNLELLRDVCAATDRPGGRLRRHHRARRPRGAAGPGRRRGRGRDHRDGALRGPVHARGRARPDPAALDTHEHSLRSRSAGTR